MDIFYVKIYGLQLFCNSKKITEKTNNEKSVQTLNIIKIIFLTVSTSPNVLLN